MASGHIGTHGRAEGVTVPGGSPHSAVTGPPEPVEHPDAAGQPAAVGAQPPLDPRRGHPVEVEPVRDETLAAARRLEPGQEFAAGEG